MSNCVKIVNHPKIKVGEHGRHAIILNPGRGSHFVGQIDGCLIQDGVRCDCFVSNSTHISLIEFKGSDIDHACEQLFSSVSHDFLSTHVNGKRKSFLIVCSRFPRNNTSVQRFQAKARRDHGANLRVVCNKAEIQLGDF